MIRSRGIARLESCMQFPVPQITTLLLLVHLGFGCCWHHAHTWAAVCCDAVDCCDATVANIGFGSCEADYHNDPHQRHKDGDRHPQHCEETSCVFARLDHAPDWDGAASMAVSFWVTTASNHEEGRSDLLLHRRLDHFLSDARPPLRVHLAYQVLLI